MKRLSYEDVKEWIEENSECKLLSKEYKNAITKLSFKCKCGKEFGRTFDGFKSDKLHLCKSCSNKRQTTELAKRKQHLIRQKPIDDVINLVELEMKCKFIKRYTKDGTRSTLVEFECPKHGLQKVFWTNLVKRRSCPCCNEHNKQNSRLTKKREQFLKENDIKYIKEHKFEECKIKRKLPFDFYLCDSKTCIEVNGRQHYEKAYFGGWSDEVAEQKLIETRKHDDIKRNFCKDNNITLIEIPFFTDDKEKTYLKILNKATLGEVSA